MKPQEKVYDFLSGKEIPTVNGKGTVSVSPGGGVIIFVGSESEFKKVASQM